MVASRGILAIAMVQVIVATALLVPWYLSRRKIFAFWPRRAGTGFAAPVAATGGVLLVAVGTHLLDSDLVTDLAVAACTASAALVLMISGCAPVYLAVRRAGTGAAQAGRIADVIGPALAVVLEAPFYPVAELLSPRVPRLGPPSAARDLGSRIRSGAKWSVLNSLLVRIGNFVVGMVLARTVFGPSVWGLYAISQLVLALLLSANELGVSAAIIRWEGDMRSFARTVYTLSLITSAMMYAVLYLTAPGIARMLGSPGATPMLRVLCICVVLDALCAVPLALLTREFAQGRRMVVDVLNFAADNLVTLWLAFTGWGVMSFAWGALAGCAVALIAATAAAPYVILPGWNTAQARQLLRFGLPLAWASLFGLGVLNVDSAIVGAVLGPAMLGLYQLAFNISSWPATTISLAVQRVSFAGFSRVADTADGLEATFTQALGLLLALTVPACVLLATLAAPLIHIVYGDRWAAAAHALSLLAVLGLMRVVYGLFYNCIAAAGRRTLLMGIQGLWLAALIPVLIAGALLRGITGVSAGHVIVAAGLIGPAFLWGLSRTGIRIRSVAAVCVRPLIGGAAMVVASLLAVRLAGSGLTGLALATAGGVGVYLPFVYPVLALLRPSSPVSHERPEAAVPSGRPDAGTGCRQSAAPGHPDRENTVSRPGWLTAKQKSFWLAQWLKAGRRRHAPRGSPGRVRGAFRGPGHPVADDHEPAAPPSRKGGPSPGPYAGDRHPAGGQEPVMFPRDGIDDMKIPRLAVIGFKDSVHDRAESLADERVEHEDHRGVVRNGPFQYISGDGLHFWHPQPGRCPFHVSLRAPGELLVQLHADHTAKGELRGDEEYLPFPGTEVHECDPPA